LPQEEWEAGVVFSSYIFIFAFLPLTVLGFHACSKIAPVAAKTWLCAASIVFYGYWFIGWVPVLFVSILFNYLVGIAIRTAAPGPRQTGALIIGIGANLMALIYYKYLYAVLTFLHITSLAGTAVDPIALPLGISFFTFTQIAYLVDTSQGYAREYSFLNYLLFVTFFPHLIAGPIVHHRDLMPQFDDPKNHRLQPHEFAIGLTIFVIGLVKKTVIADRMSGIANGFLQPDVPLDALAAWIGMLAYSMQLYFDFSGYSDMAIGLARMFGIKFPINFNSPYKATSIIDFWQRWHITLTRFLTAYVYNPIALYLTRRRAAAGKPTSKKAVQTLSGFLEMIALPMMVTMTLAGVWHGAGLQFVLFGVLHGLYLSINHVWRTFGPRRGGDTPRGSAIAITRIASSMLLTYLAVLLGQVFFRAESVDAALSMLAAMADFGGFDLPNDAFAAHLELGEYIRAAVLLGAVMLIAWTAPNTLQIMAACEPALGLPRSLPAAPLQWRMNMRWALVVGIAFLAGALSISENQPFIYFQF
jgi:D-alanyl-lipoteichoic acid acyltransferase DltB (MBOAT superfamily)